MVTACPYSRYAGAALAILFILAGCGGSQAGAPAAPQQAATTTEHPDRGGSRIARDASTSAFTVSGRTILLNGQPFYIKGVDYGNTQIDAYADPNPLDDANAKVWTPDLAAMRAAGVNAVKVYNLTLASFKPYESILGGFNTLRPYETGKIDKFLDAAWNGGKKPIYVVLSIFFGGDNVLQPAYLNALKAVYGLTSTQYAGYPAVMGFSLGSEINSESLIGDPVWWKGLNEISDSITKGYKAAVAKKIVTTTMVDMVIDKKLATVVAGEKNGFKIDAWGIDSYRGYTFTDIWKQIKSATTKPEIMAEYGSSAGRWTQSSATYDQSSHLCPQSTYPTGSFPPPSWPKNKPWSGAPYWGLPPGPPPPWEYVKDLPASGNPSMPFLVAQVKANATELYANSTGQGGVGSGGFYFEWNDEWWKSGWPFLHIGGAPSGDETYPNKISPTPPFPGCYWDEAWFGLNADKKTGSGDPFPKRAPDTRVPRPTLNAIKAVWASQ